MRITLRELALLALPALSNAVSLSDMTPRATGLPPQCEAVYTSQINGCTPTDFRTNQCSSSCMNALYGVAQAIGQACGGQGVTGQNLVVAFLAGVGPQQLCHNLQDGGPPTGRPNGPPTQGPPPQTHWSPTIGSSTTTAQSPTNTKSLLVDTSSTMTATIIPEPSSSSSISTKKSTTAKTTAAHTPTQQPSPITTSAKSTTSSAAGNSQTDLNDHSGGGSPFDTPGNVTNGAPAIFISTVWTMLSAAAMLMALR